MLLLIANCGECSDVNYETTVDVILYRVRSRACHPLNVSIKSGCGTVQRTVRSVAAHEILFFKKLENVPPRFPLSFSGIHLYLLASKESSMLGELSCQIRDGMSTSLYGETKQKGGVAQS